MCGFNNSEPLVSTNNGTVSLSHCGNYFRVIYNNIVLYQNPKAFDAFWANVTQCYRTIRTEENQPKSREICFNTKIDSMMLVFSHQEVAELHYLLDTAKLEHEMLV